VRSSASLAELEALGVSESARWTVKVGAVTQDITARKHTCDGPLCGCSCVRVTCVGIAVGRCQ
jgi:hypothetical protein